MNKIKYVFGNGPTITISFLLVLFFLFKNLVIKKKTLNLKSIIIKFKKLTESLKKSIHSFYNHSAIL